jgi:hypothetical protein
VVNAWPSVCRWWWSVAECGGDNRTVASQRGGGAAEVDYDFCHERAGAEVRPPPQMGACGWVRPSASRTVVGLRCRPLLHLEISNFRM